MLLATLALAADIHPTATELVSIAHLGSPAVSPDGTTALVRITRATWDPEATAAGDSENGWTPTTQLYTVPLDGKPHTGPLRALTSAEEGPGSGQWSPDGSTVLFQRDGVLHLLPSTGGEARTLELDLEPHSVRFSPDGSALRFLATPEPDEDEARARYRRGDAHRFEQADHARLFTVPLDGGEPEALTDGSRHVLDYAEASDGTFALTVADANNAYAGAIESQLVVLADGETTELEGRCATGATWNPRRTELAWVGCRTGGITDGLYLWDGKQTRNLLEHADPTVADLTWTPDGRALLVSITDRTRSAIWRVPTKGGSHEVVYQGEVLRGLVPTPDGRSVLVRASDPTHPFRLARIDLKSGKLSTVYDPNPQVADWKPSTPRIFTWDSPEASIEGVLYTPDGKGPHKLLVMPHGGPDGVTTTAFDSWAQFFVARGYAVLRPNYRGGIGYGRDFYSANRGRLGAIELMDIESGVDALFAEGIADPERLYYGGWSWGGYLTTWTIGHTDRYRAAVAGAAVTDTQAQYVGSDINHGAVGDWEFTGRPWKDWEKYDAANPRRHMTAITTPTLILHGDADRRVPFDQGVTLYRALADQGVEVEFWQYPGEGHGIRRHAHQVHRLETWLDWLEAH